MTSPNRALVVIDVQQDYVDGPVSIEYPPLGVSMPNILGAVTIAGGEGLPVAIVQHDNPAGAPVFAAGSAGWQLVPEVAAAVRPEWKRIHKRLPSVFAGTDFEQWLRENAVDTITLVGYMTNNCVQATANHALNLGIAVEVLSDATGSIPLSNAAGTASAEEVHRVIGTLLESNYAAVVPTAQWAEAVGSASSLERSNILVSTLRARGAELPG